MIKSILSLATRRCTVTCNSSNCSFVWPDSMKRREDLGDYLLPGESVALTEKSLELKMDYAHQGQERFARIYKLLDPERKWTANLSRTAVSFKNEN